MKKHKYIIQISVSIVFVLVFICSTKLMVAQNNDRIYNQYTDTLLVLGDLLVDEEKILIEREYFLDVDTLLVNQKGFQVISFKMNALALGVNLSLESKSAGITAEMKNEIVNEHTKYKFIYLKDILLLGGDGKRYYPSTKSIKIVFKN